ncbi:MAG: hypothetical protein KF869_15095 [Phycisphaeraceae bacterium]|nr:hypothetical protein [Phycisphaeraceae bacterium]
MTDQTTTRLTADAAFDLVKSADTAHGPESWPRHAAEELWRTIRDIDSTRDALVADAERLARTLARECERVRDGIQPSRLGIVQGSGGDIDRHCATLAALNDRFIRAVHACQSAGVLAEGENFTA